MRGGVLKCPLYFHTSSEVCMMGWNRSTWGGGGRAPAVTGLLPCGQRVACGGQIWAIEAPLSKPPACRRHPHQRHKVVHHPQLLQLRP